MTGRKRDFTADRAALLLAALLLAAAPAAAQPYSDPGAGIGVQVAVELSPDARGANASAGVHYRFRLTGGLGIEAGIGYRQATYDVIAGSSIRLQSIPVTGAILLFPLPDHPVQPYLLAGAGYYLVRLRGQNLPEGFDGTENQLGFLAGAGVEAQVSHGVSLFLDGRYTFLPVDTLQELQLQSRYASLTLGVTLRY